MLFRLHLNINFDDIQIDAYVHVSGGWVVEEVLPPMFVRVCIFEGGWVSPATPLSHGSSSVRQCKRTNPNNKHTPAPWFMMFYQFDAVILSNTIFFL